MASPRSFPGSGPLPALCWAVIIALSLAGCGVGGRGTATGAGSAPKTATAESAPRPAAPQAASAAAQVPGLSLDSATVSKLKQAGGFELGIDALHRENYVPLRYQRVALVTNNTGIDSHGVTTIERLATAGRFTLARVILLDDGATTSSLAIRRSLEAYPAVAVARLTRTSFRPEADLIRDIDVLVFDVALTGSRVALDAVALGTVMEEASRREKTVLVLDRPPLADVAAPSGPIPAASLAGSYGAFLPIPLMPALTAGEMATLYNTTFGIQASLRVVPMRNWRRSEGNRWLQREIGPEVTTRGRDVLRELADSPLYAADYPTLATVATLADADRYADIGFATAQQRLHLMLDPGRVTSETLVMQLRNQNPVGADVGLTTGTLLTTLGKPVFLLPRDREGEQMYVPELALQLRQALQPLEGAEPYVPEKDAMADPELPRMQMRQLSPTQIGRRLRASESVQSFTPIRDKVLLYPP